MYHQKNIQQTCYFIYVGEMCRGVVLIYGRIFFIAQVTDRVMQFFLVKSHKKHHLAIVLFTRHQIMPRSEGVLCIRFVTHNLETPIWMRFLQEQRNHVQDGVHLGRIGN